MTNEEFRGAMIYLGFKHNNAMNMNFNISRRDVNKLQRRIRNKII